MKESSRHHYIPQFYIKGFVNESGSVYVYDKECDRIWKREIKPKGIFYDWNRNTIQNETDSSSKIEDLWYKWLDDFCAPVISKFREAENNESLHNVDNISRLRFFLIHLLWRLPKFDFAFDYLFENAEKKLSNGNEVQFPSNNSKEAFKKIERTIFPNKVIRDIVSKSSTERFCSKLFEKNSDIFLLGDFPMVYRNEPTSIDQIIDNETLFPISSKRLYSLSYKSGLNFGFNRTTTLNTIIIHQSVKYVCSSSKSFLEKSVEYYKKQISTLPAPYLLETLFD